MKDKKMHSGVKFSTRWTIERYHDKDNTVNRLSQQGLSRAEIEDLGHVPYDVSIIKGNLFVDVGIGDLWDLTTGSATRPDAYSNGSAYLGVGSSNAAASAADTGLDGTDKDFQGMDATYPIRTGTAVAWKSTFGSGSANFQWEEFAVVNGTNDTDGNILNRKVTAQGTKSAGQTWVLTLTCGGS